MGKINFQTKSLLINVLPFTFLLYALDTLSFCLFIISNARSLSSSKSTNSFIINSQYMFGGISPCLWIRTACKYISTGAQRRVRTSVGKCSVCNFFWRCSTSPKCLVQSFMPTLRFFPYVFLYETNYYLICCFNLSIFLSVVRCRSKQLEPHFFVEI